jgi:hypothetical protein
MVVTEGDAVGVIGVAGHVQAAEVTSSTQHDEVPAVGGAVIDAVVDPGKVLDGVALQVWKRMHATGSTHQRGVGRWPSRRARRYRRQWAAEIGVTDRDADRLDVPRLEVAALVVDATADAIAGDTATAHPRWHRVARHDEAELRPTPITRDERRQ